jgi:hypothetical protein
MVHAPHPRQQFCRIQPDPRRHARGARSQRRSHDVSVIGGDAASMGSGGTEPGKVGTRFLDPRFLSSRLRATTTIWRCGPRTPIDCAESGGTGPGGLGTRSTRYRSRAEHHSRHSHGAMNTWRCGAWPLMGHPSTKRAYKVCGGTAAIGRGFTVLSDLCVLVLGQEWQQ